VDGTVQVVGLGHALDDRLQYVVIGSRCETDLDVQHRKDIVSLVA
jgi:hypothetical protein